VHFVQDEDGSELKRRVMLIYGIDPDRLPDDGVVTILDAIAHRSAR